MRTTAGTSAVSFVTVRSRSRGTTSGRACSECGAMNVTAIASSPHTSTGPPFERLYAVEPDGVAQISPSQGWRPRSSSPIDHTSSTMRPSVPLVTTTSFTAAPRSSPTRASRVGSSTTTKSPAKARARPSSSSSGCIEARKPTRPKLTPITGTRVPRNRVSARSIVPSPPSTTARSALAGSPSVLGRSCFSRSSSGKTSSTSCSAASASSRPSAGPIVSALPCVTTAARRTRLPDCAVDPVVELIWPLRPPAVHEVEEELAVPLRAGQAGVYDARDLCLPRERRLGHLPQHAPVHLRVADDAASPHLLPPRLELRLHEHDRLPARSGEREHRRQDEPHADEGDVAGDEARGERKLRERARVRLLQ